MIDFGRGLVAACLLSVSAVAFASEQPPTLAIGAAMPPFSLPGIDGKTYTDKSFAKADILVMVFTCAHCPTAQAYQERIKKLVTDYAPKNVTLIAINPNHADAVRLDELAYSDLSDSFEEMQERAQTGEIQLRLARRRPEAGDVARLRPGGDAARVHLRQGAQAALRRTHRRLGARVHRHQTRHARGARRAARRQGAAGHHHESVRLLGEVGRQGPGLRQLQEEVGRRAGDAREGRRGHAQGDPREQGLRQDPLHQCVGHVVRAVHHRVRRARRAQPALPHPRRSRW